MMFKKLICKIFGCAEYPFREKWTPVENGFTEYTVSFECEICGGTRDASIYIEKSQIDNPTEKNVSLQINDLFKRD